MEKVDYLPGYSSLRAQRYAQAARNIDRRFAYITKDSFIFEPRAPECNCPSSKEVPHHKLYLKTNRTYICPFMAVIRHQRAAMALRVEAQILNPLDLVILEYGDRL
jgi:hypothetical protein